MKRILFPLAFIAALTVAAFSGLHGAAHPLAAIHLDAIHLDAIHLD